MGAIGDIVQGAISGIFDAGKTIYDIWTNERDFDYQKSLQQEIFNREDNAVQRRMADLKAAGLNPNLAAGSAAGAGSVVGRSNTPSLSGNPVGAVLDVLQHKAQLEGQREQNRILANQERISEEQAEQERLATNLDKLQFYNMLGIRSDIALDYNGRTRINPSFDFQPFNNTEGWSLYSETGKNGIDGVSRQINDLNSPFMNMFNWQYQNARNSADLLQRDVDWYTADKIADYFGIGARIFSGAGSGLSGIGNFMYSRRRK